MSWSGTRQMFATDHQDKLRLSEFAALAPIDSHSHIALTTSKLVRMLQRLGAHVLDILFVNDSAISCHLGTPEAGRTHSCAQPSTGSHLTIPTHRGTRLRD